VESFKEKHTSDVEDCIMKSISYDGAIVEVTDLREEGDVRGSPVTVTTGLIMVYESTYHAETSMQQPWCTF
jgi:hypothetical protein